MMAPLGFVVERGRCARASAVKRTRGIHLLAFEFEVQPAAVGLPPMDRDPAYTVYWALQEGGAQWPVHS